MLSNLAIQRQDDLPEDIRQELSIAAIQEGFQALRWLIDEWDDGINRFSLHGEALYGARVDGRLVGVCGMNQDPFISGSQTGRLRRLYMLPEFRRRGVGRQLVLKVLDDARSYFKIVRLLTMDQNSALFFEEIGFSKDEGKERVSHHIEFLSDD